MADPGETLRDFEAHLRKDVPSLKVRFKDASLLMRVLSLLLYPFNPNFLTDYATTLGHTIYFPSKAKYEESLVNSMAVLSHEYVHMWDSRKHPVWYKVSYVFPQILALIPLGVFVTLTAACPWILLWIVFGYLVSCACAKLLGSSFWVSFCAWALPAILATLLLAGIPSLIALLLTCACLAPWPSPFRVQWELRGYGMTVAVFYWLLGHPPKVYRRGLRKELVGPSYYYMSWNSSKIEDALELNRAQVCAGLIQAYPPYMTVYDFLFARKLLYGLRKTR